MNRIMANMKALFNLASVAAIGVLDNADKPGFHIRNTVTVHGFRVHQESERFIRQY